MAGSWRATGSPRSHGGPGVGEPPDGAAACSGCHPTSPRVTSPVIRLNGLDQARIARAMEDFRSGNRPATVMDRLSKGFTDAEIQAIAAWYASQR